MSPSENIELLEHQVKELERHRIHLIDERDQGIKENIKLSDDCRRLQKIVDRVVKAEINNRYGDIITLNVMINKHMLKTKLNMGTVWSYTMQKLKHQFSLVQKQIKN